MRPHTHSLTEETDIAAFTLVMGYSKNHLMGFNGDAFVLSFNMDLHPAFFSYVYFAENVNWCGNMKWIAVGRRVKCFVISLWFLCVRFTIWTKQLTMNTQRLMTEFQDRFALDLLRYLFQITTITHEFGHLLELGMGEVRPVSPSHSFSIITWWDSMTRLTWCFPPILSSNTATTRPDPFMAYVRIWIADFLEGPLCERSRPYERCGLGRGSQTEIWKFTHILSFFFFWIEDKP